MTQPPPLAPSTLLTVATWIAELYSSGVEPQHGGIAAACAAVKRATDAAAGEVAGHQLVEAVGAELAGDSPEAVAALASTLYGSAVSTAMGEGNRGARTSRIRKYQFSRRLPWLARIVERRSNGAVTPGWLVVQGCTDQVHALDPNPWNDIDEQRDLPLADFLVLWELDACASVFVN